MGWGRLGPMLEMTSRHSTPYGLGNLAERQKRALDRCECAHSRDSICTTFCHKRPCTAEFSEFLLFNKNQRSLALKL
uniref:Uncharacterized protein n=1 Tax=Sphaerodactylus townsendi TaxID=933632 RepID=A0ACB8FRF2_9SAUR